MFKSVTQDMAAYHLECIPEYLLATEYTKTCKLHCLCISQLPGV